MGEGNWFDYLEEDVLPELERLDGFERLLEVAGPQIREFMRDDHDFLTENVTEARAYRFEYGEHQATVSVEVGGYDGEDVLGFSADLADSPVEAFEDIMSDISNLYNSELETVNHGDYIIQPRL